jgi:hypothetical protein
MAPHEMHRALTDNKAKNARRVAVAATAPTRGSQNVASANTATTLVWFECGNCWTLGDPNFQRDFVNNLQSVTTSLLCTGRACSQRSHPTEKSSSTCLFTEEINIYS